jgi:hypothetical protein
MTIGSKFVIPNKELVDIDRALQFNTRVHITKQNHHQLKQLLLIIYIPDGHEEKLIIIEAQKLIETREKLMKQLLIKYKK